MKLIDPNNPVTSAWFVKEGHRLDAPPYLSGGVEARVALDKLRVPKQPLKEVTRGYNGGIFNGPQFKRFYVDSLEYGIPFLGSASILQSDLSKLPFISKKSAFSPKLLPLHVEEGMTLISCSGTIGRMAYARSEMVGMLTSQHVMKIVPNPEVILPGYLYAYLGSRFGQTLITSGTYGAIIQHIEPEHIEDLQVPRFGEEFESKVHELIFEAAELRSQASESLKIIREDLLEKMEIIIDDTKKLYNIVSSKRLADQDRMEGYYYNAIADSLDSQIRNGDFVEMNEVATIYDVSPFKHIYVTSSSGVPFFTSAEIFKSDISAELFLSRTKTKGLEKYLIPEKSILIARSGQIGGNIGRCILFSSALKGASTSDHVIRVVPIDNLIDYGYLYAILDSLIGYYLLIRNASGKSIPALWASHIQRIPIPRFSREFESAISDKTIEAFENKHRATVLEIEARRLVEHAIASNFVPHSS